MSVASVADLKAEGVSRHVVAARVRSGRWQRILPGVVALHSGPLPDGQRRDAALLYGGPGSVLSHRSAAVLHGLRVREGPVEITVPHGRHHCSAGFVVVHQSGRPVRRRWLDGQPCTDAARTVVDVACTLRRRDEVRALVSDSVQRHLVTVAELLEEAASSPRHAPLLLRRALDEVAAGARSASEARFLRLLRDSGLPEPEFNARVWTPGGWFVVDVLWRDRGLGVEIDGAAWHLDAVSWQRDLRRQNLLAAVGITLLRFPATRVRDDPDGVLGEVRSTLRLRRPS